MKKRLWVVFATVCVLLALCVAALFIFKQYKNHENGQDYLEEYCEKILQSPCAKIECYEDDDDSVYVTGEIYTLSSYFSSITLAETDEEADEWIYRIVFDCNEIAPDSDEIEVLIGENLLSINGRFYTTPEGVDFAGIREDIRAKYDFFRE